MAGASVEIRDEIERKGLRERNSSWNLSTIADWANESRSMALKSVYNVKKKSLSEAYIERGREIIDLRLTQARVRLAHLLNTILTIK